MAGVALELRSTILSNQDLRISASPTFVDLTLTGLVQGSVLFAGSGGLVSEDNSNLFWDDTNKRLKVKGDIIYHGTSYILSGMSEDRQDMFLTTSAGNVFFETEKIGGGDIEYLFDEIEYDLDCTTGSGTGGRAQVQLTEGSVTNPQINYVYITLVGSTATLTASTSLPTGQFAWVALIVIQSDTEIDAADGGPLAYQRFTETYKHDSRGSLSHMREKIRYLGADYLGGMAQSLIITANGGADTVVLTTALGKVYQLHRQDWPTYDISSDGIWVANASGAGTLTKYQRLTDLNSVLETTNGDAIGNNKRFNLVIWGSINFTTGDCKMFVNLPTGVYQDDDQTISDENGTAVTTIPTEFQTTGFLIARLPLKYSSAGGGTWTNLMGGTSVIDLRGLPTGFNLGSGATVGATATFSDADFEVFDNGDDTSRLMFQVSGVSTGTTRTMTIPNVSGTLVTSANPEDLGGVLQDLNTLGPNAADSEFLVGTGAGALAWENATTTRTSLGLVIGTDVLAQQTIGIADNNLLEVDDADANDDDYAKFTANGLEGRSWAEVLSDLSNQAEAAFAWNSQNLTGVGTIASGVHTVTSSATNWNILATNVAGNTNLPVIAIHRKTTGLTGFTGIRQANAATQIQISEGNFKLFFGTYGDLSTGDYSNAVEKWACDSSGNTHAEGEVRADTHFDINGVNGSSGTLAVVTTVNFTKEEVTTVSMTFAGGIITSGIK